MGELGERQDPSGGIMYNQFDRVRVEYTWKDRIRKETEARLSGPRSGFQMNMAQLSASGGFLHLKHAHNRLETVVEKEIKQSPQQRMSAEGMDPNSMEVLAIKHMARRPPEKFDTPMTTTHELGWLLESPVQSKTLLPPPKETMRKSGSTGQISHMPGTLVCTLQPRTQPYSQLSVTTPANSLVLERTLSAPILPKGEPLPALRKINNPRWRRPKSSSDVTRYAEAFYNMNGCSPFASSAGK
ncbi:NLRC3 [Symbiodinium sp. CCMP2592]|nr:NLRC3 [Symbiodinium sp. CCMP2592]